MKVQISKLVVWIPLLFSFAFHQVALADAGRIQFVSGAVVIERGDESIPAEKDFLLIPGDQIVTLETGRVQWRLADDSNYVMKPNSRFLIKDFEKPQNSTTAQGKSYIELLQGGFRTISGAIPKINENNYQVKTNLAIIGIRGTDYTAIILNDEEAAALGLDAGLYVRVSTGGVELSNSGGSISLAAGQIGFASNIGVSPVVIIDAPTVLINLFDDISFEFQVEFFQDLEIDLRIEPEQPASPS